MVRYWAVALLVLTSLPASGARAGAGKEADKDIKIESELTNNDPRDPRRMAASKVHTVKLKAGKVYTIDMMARFDTWLRLEDPDGKELIEDDDSGDGTNSRIVFTCSKDGAYKIVCTAFNQQGVGPYTLTVKTAGRAQPNTSAHAVLLGKMAPDFQGDFAVNGRPTKLSGLKGKVVLVQFWEVRSAPSIATFIRLRDWQKAHRANGFEVVGVTFYHHEVTGQKLGFDRTTGQLVTLDKATKATEQQMLADFAAYHKLDHLLTVLSREEALKVFDAYAVNGLPQFVLIDRRGVVRALRVGEAEGTVMGLADEIKKLLAEKE